MIGGFSFFVVYWKRCFANFLLIIFPFWLKRELLYVFCSRRLMIDVWFGWYWFIVAQTVVIKLKDNWKKSAGVLTAESGIGCLGETSLWFGTGPLPHTIFPDAILLRFYSLYCHILFFAIHSSLFHDNRQKFAIAWEVGWRTEFGNIASPYFFVILFVYFGYAHWGRHPLLTKSSRHILPTIHFKIAVSWLHSVSSNQPEERVGAWEKYGKEQGRICSWMDVSVLSVFILTWFLWNKLL